MKSILLIGLGRFGRHIAQELNELGHQVMAIDSNEDRVNAVLSYVTNAQIGDIHTSKLPTPRERRKYSLVLSPICAFVT